jgi:transcriptional regulator with GAF, ATPase, and Fis domain
VSDGDDLATVTRASSPLASQGGVQGRLWVVHPFGLDWDLLLGSDKQVIGRVAQSVAPALGHETVSRRHVEIGWSRRAHAHVIRDLGSHNGSRVDGVELGTESVALGDQSVIQLGDVSLVYERVEPIAFADDDTSREAIPGNTVAVARLRDLVQRAGPDPSPVLLIGETGTGKEWISRELHRLSGRTGPLVAINCAALSPEIIDSQLFGHVKGAFTGATSDSAGMFRAAEGGTLFLDEIGEMPLSLQPKLLRALQEGDVQPVGSTKLVSVDVRVIAATNRVLASAVEAGEFRRDLYARLALWEIPVPALRNRRGDLLAWIVRLHQRWLAERPGQLPRPLEFTPEAVEKLLLFDWPNNLRELDRLVHSLSSAPNLPATIGAEHLPTWVQPRGTAPIPASLSASVDAPGAIPVGKRPVPSREEFVEVFDRLDGNVRAMAKHFERDRRQIYRWIESYGLGERRQGGKGADQGPIDPEDDGRDDPG